MVYRTFAVLIFLIFFPFALQANDVDPYCDTHSIQHSASQIQSQAHKASCLESYHKNKCEEFKKTLGPENQNKVFNCDRSDSAGWQSGIIACGAGIESFVVDSVTGVIHAISQIPHLPAAVWNELQKSADFIQKCSSDGGFRESLFKSISPLYSDSEKQSLLRELPCEGLIQLVRQQSTNALIDIQNKEKLQARFRERAPERPLPSHLQISEGETEFRQNYFAASDLAKNKINSAIQKIWNEISSKLACYIFEAKVEATCKVAADVAAKVGSAGLVAVLAPSDQVRLTLSHIVLEVKNDEYVLQLRKMGFGHSEIRNRLYDRERVRTDQSVMDTANNTQMDLRAVQAASNSRFSPENTAQSKIDQRKRMQEKIHPDNSALRAQRMHLAPSQISYSPLVKLPNRSYLPVELTLQEGAIKSQRPIQKGKGVNDSQIVTFKDGTQGVWKPHSEVWSSNYRAEVLAYEIDRSLGLNLVPPTVVRTIDGEIGSVQLFNSGKPVKSGASVKRTTNDEVSKQAFLDYIIENRDRHTNNFLVNREGHVVSIDNGTSFTGIGGLDISFSLKKNRIDSFLNSEEGRSSMVKLRAFVSDPRSYAAVESYLGKADTDRLIQRMKLLIQYSEKPKVP